MSFLVTRDAKSDQILGRVITQSTPRLNVMDLKIPRSSRTIGNASRLAPGLHGRAGDRLQDQASSVAVWIGSQSKDDLNVLEELLPLRLRKAEYQPSESRQKSILVARLQARPRQKIRADHLQAVAARLVAPEHQSRCFERLLDHRKLALVSLEIEDLPRLGLFAGQVMIDLALEFLPAASYWLCAPRVHNRTPADPAAPPSPIPVPSSIRSARSSRLRIGVRCSWMAIR